MKRQTNNGLMTRIYSYGCVPARIAPVKNEEAALVQLRLANRLWNTLVAIERARLAGYRRIMQDEQQERADALAAEIQAVREQIKAVRKTARKRAVDLGDLPEKLAALKADRGAIIAALKQTSRARHDARKPLLKQNADRAFRRIRRARQAAARMGLFWGSYNDIVQRADAGRKLGDLHFRAFRGEGTLTAQIIGGAKVAHCVDGGHTFFQIDCQGQDKFRYARVRIGSNADRSPVWLEVPIVYHRDIPDSGRIKSVSATRRIVAGKVRWQLNVMVNLPSAPQKTGPRTVAIDIGWRKTPEGVRVAYWHDGTNSGDVVVPNSDIDQFARIESLRSCCDRMRDEFLPTLAAWLGAQSISEEWSAHSANLLHWRSADRLAGLIRWWADHRIDGDAEIFREAVLWRRQYMHLANWARNLSEQMTLRLRERYRVFAARIARDYDRVLLEDFDLRGVVEKKQPEDNELRTKSARYRQIVSPSALRLALRSTCAREGTGIVMVQAAFTTRRCHHCGHDGAWDQADNVMHQCERCKVIWDQDENACLNMLGAWDKGNRVAGQVVGQ